MSFQINSWIYFFQDKTDWVEVLDPEIKPDRDSIVTNPFPQQMSPINKSPQSVNRLVSWTKLISLGARMRPQIVGKIDAECKSLGFGSVIVQTGGASICPHPPFNERAAIGRGTNHGISRDTWCYKPTLGCLSPITAGITIAGPHQIIVNSRTDLSSNHGGRTSLIRTCSQVSTVYD